MRSTRKKRTRKISLFIMLIVLISFAFAISAFADDEQPSGVKGDTCYKHGDINADGRLTSKDPIKLLYLTMPFEGENATGQSLDFDGDGDVDQEDAIHLLYSINGDFFGGLLDDYSLAGDIHAYGAPVWNWNLASEEPTATATFQCACGEKRGTVNAAVTLDTDSSKAPTCTEAGSKIYTATAEYAGVTYSASKTVVLEATGHHFADDAALCSARACLNEGCTYTETAAAHSYQLSETTPATCTEAATSTYTCEYCGTSYTEKTGNALGHTLDPETLVETPVDGSDSCEYVQTYDCLNCDAKGLVGGHVHKHEYAAAITTEATCNAEGEKTYTCKNCGDTYQEDIPVNVDAHTWNNGEKDEVKGITTYTCTVCDAVKTTVDASTANSASVSKDTLSAAGEVELKDASIKLDEATLAQLDENKEINISVTTVEKETLNITDDEKDQIGTNPVYDFSLTSGDDSVSAFDGTVTVTLPYELQAGDDVDCIDVWFIDDDGHVEIVQGTYSNGYVTFTTNHFSYYTVTRLTPAQRCEAYGHSDAQTVIAPTCTASGYTLHVCTRCTQTWKTDDKECLNHDYKIEETPATCETDGKRTEICNNCGDVRETVLPKTGHSWLEDGEGTAASCTQSGSQSYKCSICDATRTETYAQLPHELTSTVVLPTCETKGYTLNTCVNCDYEVKEEETEATGHTFQPEWSWTVDGGEVRAVVTLTCENDETHSVNNKDAVIDIKRHVDPTCTKEGSTIYSATISYNQKTYSDEYEVTEEKTGHNPSDEWEYGKGKHYHVCSWCGGKVDLEDHVLDEGVAITEATCTTEGLRMHTCKCGYQEEQTVPPLGHELVDGACTRCDFTVNGCTHDRMTKVVVELTEADGVCPGTYTYMTCDCGQEKYLLEEDYACEWSRESEIFKDDNGYECEIITDTCQNCGAVRKQESSWEITGECEGLEHYKYTLSDRVNTLLYEFHEEYNAGQHPVAVYDEEIDLSQYGLCGGSAVIKHCPCGEAERVLLFDDACQWEYDLENSEPTKDVYHCSVCGIEKIATWGEGSTEGCQARVSYLYTFNKNGETVAVFKNQYILENHNSTYEYVLDNPDGSCLDGFTVTETCLDCGFVDSWHNDGDYHPMLTEKTIDLADYNGCGGTIISTSCPCGEESYVQEDLACSLEYDSWDEEETEDGRIETQIYICPDCGLKKEEVSLLKPTEYACTTECEITTSYWMGEEKLLETTSHSTRHSDEYTQCVDYELMGDSCRDGVAITEKCTLCGEEFEGYYTYHHCFVKERYHLADYGLCGGELQVKSCACGLDGYLYEKQGKDGCQWRYYGYDEKTDTEMYKCQSCGMMKYESYSSKEIDGCKWADTERYEYRKGYNVALNVENVREWENHDLIYEFKLDHDGGTCADGFMVYESCRNCDYQDSWHEQTEYHYNRCTEVIDLADYGFCDGSEFRHYQCPCGDTGRWNRSYGEDACRWDWSYYDEETDATWYQCSVCGCSYSESQQALADEGCYKTNRTTYTFYDKDKVEKLSVQSSERTENHQYIHTFALNGTTCSDGYTVTEVCQKCGKTSSWTGSTSEGEHWNTYTTEIYDLGEKGFCGGTIEVWECPCGERHSFSCDCFEYCDFMWLGCDAETGTDTYECTKCHGSYTLSHREETIDTCHFKSVYSYCFRNSDGEEVACCERMYPSENHKNTYSFELNGDSCTDGYVVKNVCSVCGASGEQYESGHWDYLLETVELDGFCESLGVYGCACGQNRDYRVISTSCNWAGGTYDDSTHTTTWICSECGNKKTETHTKGEKDAQCVVQYCDHTAYINKAGETVYEYDKTWTGSEHAYVYTYEMQGSTCEDGYYVSAVCRDCGDSFQNSDMEYSHWSHPVEYVDFGEKGLCGGTLIHYSCACGEEKSWSFWENTASCDWEYVSSNENTERWICTVCGAEEERSHASKEIDSCHVQEVCVTTYRKDGEVVYTYTEEHVNETHDCVYTLSLREPGTTCENGVYATGTCRKCQAEVTAEEWWHRMFCTQLVELSDLGLCGGVYRVEECACGQERNQYVAAETCVWNYQTTETDGTEIYHCAICDGTKKVYRTETEKDENCNVTVTYTASYLDEQGKEVLSYTNAWTDTRHDLEVIRHEMNGTSCEEGYIEYLQCKTCGAEEICHYSYHDKHRVKEYDLSEYGACEGATMALYSCYCGAYQELNENLYGACDISYTSNQYVDENGLRHEVEVGACRECGLRISRDCTSVRDAQTCVVDTTEVVTITVGSTAVDSLILHRSETSHDFEEQAVLMDGAETCEDGVRVTRICKDCGFSDSYTSFGHGLYEEADSREDLSQYGSVCGGYVVQESCACGQRRSLTLKDVDCDFDRQYESAWLGDNLSSQETTEGYFYPSRDGYIQTCAVTDPEPCGFAIRSCDYYVWDKENCCVTEYTTWQLGYDPVTGEYQKEITIETGDTHTYHNYEVSQSEEMTELGSTRTTTRTCNVCGSTHVETDMFNTDGEYVKTEEVFTNTLENGKAQSRTIVNEWTYYQGEQYQTLWEEHTVNADDTESWSKSEHCYDWDNFDCTCIYRYSDSDGSYRESEEACHRVSWTYEWETCTQYGMEKSHCLVCGNDVDSYLRDPDGHRWYYDESKSLYVCSDCGLENVNGADGQIVMEDLTAEYGENDASYVVGYWNKENVQYSYYLSVICNEIEEGIEGHEMILSGIDFTEKTRKVDGINAVAFSQDAANAAAAAAVEEAGYTGSYDLRFTFVPVGSDGSFDYAITFTNAQ